MYHLTKKRLNPLLTLRAPSRSARVHRGSAAIKACVRFAQFVRFVQPVFNRPTYVIAAALRTGPPYYIPTKSAADLPSHCTEAEFIAPIANEK